jgi:hypothetical protein
MKKIILYSAIGFLILNTVFGFVLSIYLQFNWLLNDFVIITNALLMYFLFTSEIKDGFKISYSFAWPLLGAIQFVLALFMSSKIEDNIQFLLIIAILFLQILMLVIGKFVSKAA